jgi:hypothetical protein
MLDPIGEERCDEGLDNHGTGPRTLNDSDRKDHSQIRSPS